VSRVDTALLGVRLLAIDSAVAERAADMRALYNLRTPDALQVAAALTVGCDAFLTNDRAIARLADLRVLVLSDFTV
jgi:predicted nucleic acid-binding protein